MPIPAKSTLNVTTLLFAILIFMPVCTVNAAIYKCKNTDGNIEFSGTPCKGAELDKIEDNKSQGRTQRITTRILPERVQASVMANSITMQAEDAVAVYFISKNKLSVFLAPRLLDVNEIDKLKQDKADYFISGRASPDPLLWKEFPSVALDIYFKQGQIPTVESTANFDFKLTNLTQPPTQDNVAVGGVNAGKRFKKFALNMKKNDGILELSYEDNNKISDNRYLWNIDVKVPVIVVQ